MVDIAAGTAGVDRALRGVDHEHPGTHGAHEAGELLHGLPAHPEADEQARQLGRRGLPVQDGADGALGLVGGQALTTDHRGQGASNGFTHAAADL